MLTDHCTNIANSDDSNWSINFNNSLTPSCVFSELGKCLFRNQSFNSRFSHLSTLCDLYSLRRHFDLPASSNLITTIHKNGSLLECGYDSYTQSNFHILWLCIKRNNSYQIATLLSNADQTVALERRHREMYESLFLTSRKMSVGEMVTTIAHELNQPLAALTNYLEIADLQCSSSTSNPEIIKAAIQKAIKQTSQASQVISRIREYIQNSRPTIEQVDISDLMEDVIDLLSLEIKAAQVQTRTSIAGQLPKANADPIMITQVLNNLIRNAIEAMQQTPTHDRLLSIQGDRDAEGRIRVTITDRGCGIDSSETQVFKPFFTTKKQGMGAGLAICRSIVEYHGGNLYFVSNKDNGEPGTSFIFTLPTAQHNNNRESGC